MLNLHRLCLLALFALPLNVLAQTQSSTFTSSPTPSPSLISDFNDPGGANTESPANLDPNAAGASGKSQSAVSLSTGAQIAIAIVVGIVVLLGITSAVLFYVAKKRQWEVRASIRRSARRVTTAIKAKTPVRANFSRSDKDVLQGGRGMLRMDSDLPARSNGDTARSKKNKKNAPTLNLKGGRTNPDSVDQDRDIEKGFGTQTRIEATSSQQQVVPESSFDMDSPLAGGNRAGAGGEKGRGWMRMLGRK